VVAPAGICPRGSILGFTGFCWGQFIPKGALIWVGLTEGRLFWGFNLVVLFWWGGGFCGGSSKGIKMVDGWLTRKCSHNIPMHGITANMTGMHIALFAHIGR